MPPMRASFFLFSLLFALRLAGDEPPAKPRYLEMVSWSFGKLRTVAPDYAMLDIMGGVTNQKPGQKSGDQPPTPEN